MAAYVVAEVEVHNPDEFEQYSARVVETVERYGGRYLVRGGEAEAFEGTWKPKRLTILEFPTAERLRTWYRSPEYQAIVGFRHRACKTNLVAVSGSAAV